MSAPRYVKTSMVIRRYSYAACVLVLMPLGTVKTVANPSGYHVILLAATVAWTVVVGKAYRISVARWRGGSDA